MFTFNLFAKVLEHFSIHALFELIYLKECFNSYYHGLHSSASLQSTNDAARLTKILGGQKLKIFINLYAWLNIS